MEDVPLSVAPMDKPDTDISLEKTPIFEVLPTTQAAMTEPVTTAEHVSLETPQDKVAESEVNITISASACKNHSILDLAHIFLYMLLNPKIFVEVPAEVAPPPMLESKQKEEATPPVIDSMLLGLIHQRVI